MCSVSIISHIKQVSWNTYIHLHNIAKIQDNLSQVEKTWKPQ